MELLINSLAEAEEEGRGGESVFGASGDGVAKPTISLRAIGL